MTVDLEKGEAPAAIYTCGPTPMMAEVARIARKILDGDKAGRRRLDEKMGLPLDPSVS